MANLFPKIEDLQQVPLIHEQYASAALTLAMRNILSEPEFEVGLFIEGADKGSEIAFDADDFENIQLTFRFTGTYFILSINEHGDDFDMSNFRYKIYEDSPLYKLIPDTVVKAMDQVFDNDKPGTFKSNA